MDLYPGRPTDDGAPARYSLSGQLPSILVPVCRGAAAVDLIAIGRRLGAALARPVRCVPVGPALDSLPQALEACGLPPEHVLGCVVDPPARDIEQLIEREERGGPALLLLAPSLETAAVAPTALQAIERWNGPFLTLTADAAQRVIDNPRLFARLLLPLDGTPAAAAGLRLASKLAEACGAEIDVLHVAQTGRSRAPAWGAMTAPRYVDQPHLDWPAWAHEFVERFCRHLAGIPAGVRTRLFLERGDAAEAILEVAALRRSDLIALVCRLRPRANRLITQVIDRASCPVLVLRPQP